MTLGYMGAWVHGYLGTWVFGYFKVSDMVLFGTRPFFEYTTKYFLFFICSKKEMESKKKTVDNIFSGQDDLQELIEKNLKKTGDKCNKNKPKDNAIDANRAPGCFPKISIENATNSETVNSVKIRLSSVLYNEIKEIVLISNISSPEKRITIKSYIEKIVESFLSEHQYEILDQKKLILKNINQNKNK